MRTYEVLAFVACVISYIAASNPGKSCPPNSVLTVCPPKCPGDSCDVRPELILCEVQPKPGDKKCLPTACRCKSGYCNKHGKCIPRKDIQTCNQPNEIWSDCPPICPPQTCKALNKKYSCPRKPRKCNKNTKGECICKPGHYRNSIGQCVTKEECLRCQGKNEFYSCGGACDNICKILPYQNQTHCPIINVKCNEMCYCEDGYARNADNVCVPYCQCEPPCGPNEDFIRCQNRCPGESCQDYTKRKSTCSRDPPPSNPGRPCKNECVCKEGYFRDEYGDCVPYEECPEPGCCPKGEILSTCPPEDPCDGEFCPSSRNDPLSCPVPTECGRPQCVCGFNSHRSRETGKCIPTRDCPPFKCDGINEVYNPCPPVCPGERCTDYLHNAKCPKYKIGIVMPCKPQCRCKPEHYRDSAGICVPGKMCKLAVKCKPTETPVTPDPTKVPVTTTPEEDLNALILANEKFTSSFFYALTKENPGENIISSPFSVLFPLALLCLYTKGDSRVELENALNLYDDDQIKSAIRALIDHVESQQEVDLSYAFKVFVNYMYTLSDGFLDDIKTFDSDAENLNFSDNIKAAKIINDWVAEKTHDKIKDILPPSLLSSATRLVIANCIYFLGNWTKQFDEKLTTKRDFYLDANTKVQKDTMFKVDNFKYGDSDELESQVLELPYKGNNITLLLILPYQVDGIQNLYEKLQDHTLLKNAYDKMSSQKVRVYLPKVEFETKINLKNVLQRIGIKKIFTGDSGITGILKVNELLLVSDALQKAYLKINERGTEAAAANGIGIGGSRPMPPVEEITFKVDHGCIYQIRLGDVTVFMGVLVK